MLLGAGLALVGNIIVLVIVSIINQQAQRQINQYEFDRSLQGIRQDLFRDMSASLNQIGELRALDEFLSGCSEFFSLARMAPSEESSAIVYKIAPQMFKARMLLARMNSDAISTMQMSILYYGPDVQLAISNVLNLGEDWWTAADSMYSKILNTMLLQLQQDAHTIQKSWGIR